MEIRVIKDVGISTDWKYLQRARSYKTTRMVVQATGQQEWNHCEQFDTNVDSTAKTSLRFSAVPSSSLAQLFPLVTGLEVFFGELY